MKSRNLLTGMAIAIAMSATIIACSKDDNNPPALRSKEYTLVPVGASGVSGKVTILENADKTLALTVALDKSVKDTIHVSHIHSGSISNPGAVVIPLSSITGTGGAASATTAISSITYDSLLNYMGYVNVHYSAYRIDSLITQSNIGKSNP